MKAYGVNELRRMFLEFFESKGHLAMKSFSLVPHNDNSLLLINSGMAPLKPYFTGQEIPPRRRAVSYTHLDVYKRQRYRTAKLRRIKDPAACSKPHRKSENRADVWNCLLYTSMHTEQGRIIMICLKHGRSNGHLEKQQNRWLLIPPNP